MDLAKLDNWKTAKAKIKRHLGDDLYKELADAIEVKAIDKLLSTMDEWVAKKMSLYESVKGRLMNPEELDDITEINKRIISYHKILAKKRSSILDELEDDAKKTDTEEDKELIEEVADLLDDELSDYLADYASIWKYNDQVVNVDTVEAAQQRIDTLKNRDGFKQGELRRKIQLARGYMDEVGEAVRQWREINDAPRERRRGAVKVPDLVDTYNKKIPSNGNGLRSVTTHIKGFRQILDIIRKANLDSVEGFASLTVPMVDNYNDFLKYVKMSSKFINALTPYTNSPGNISLSDYELGIADIKLCEDVEAKLVHAEKLISVLENKFRDVL